ncbi:MAG TPA: hypothetical protein VNH11_18620 [Pirellulales bacterium]|nr:hypothetical protein [Pirellulales bacterium]
MIHLASLAGALALAGLLGATPAGAHGWHNAALTTSSLEEWLGDVQRAIPDILKRATETELHAGRGLEDLKKQRPGRGQARPAAPAPQRGRQIISQLTPQQQELLGRKAEDALEALAFMDPANIFPEEFPRFDLSKVSQYRETAVKLLRLMGPVGTRAVISELRAELMGMGRSQKATDYRVNPARYGALLALLYEGVSVGEADAEDVNSLHIATKGAKPPPLDALARLVEETLTAAEASRDTLPKLADRLIAPGDARLKELLLAALEKRLPEATIDELAELMQHVEGSVRQKATLALSKRADEFSVAQLIDLESKLLNKNVQIKRTFYEIFRMLMPKATGEELLALAKQDDLAVRALAQGFLAKSIHSQSVAGLLDMQQLFAGDPLARTIAAELTKRSPKYADVKDQLEQIIAFLGSTDAETARAAERQAANAFQRAPIRECLRWLATDDDRLQKLIWKQIDGRIARADAQRESGYRQVAFEELADDDVERGSRLAAIELIERLADPASAGLLVDVLPKLPRELWPRSGEALRKLTRQDFGPRPGDGAAELNAALEKWRAWLSARSKQ